MTNNRILNNLPDFLQGEPQLQPASSKKSTKRKKHTLDSTIRRLNINKRLAELFGGTWKYNGTHSWQEEGTLRHVERKVSLNDESPVPRFYLYDGDTCLQRLDDFR